MVSELEKYKFAKDELRNFEQWASMIGKKYYGGGGGYGKIISANLSATIYYQAYNGDKNYHDSDNEINAALSEAVKDCFCHIVENATKKLRMKVEEAAKKAYDENTLLLREAGLLKNEGES